MVRKIIQPWWIRKQIALTVARLPSWGLRCCRPKEPLSEPRRGEFRRRAANRRANRTGNAACQEIVFESSWRHIFFKSFLWRSFAHSKTSADFDLHKSGTQISSRAVFLCFQIILFTVASYFCFYFSAAVCRITAASRVSATPSPFTSALAVASASKLFYGHAGIAPVWRW